MLISWDQTNVQYPLQLNYYIATNIVNSTDGLFITYLLTNVTVQQRRVVDSDH